METIESITEDSTYNLSCTGPGGTKQDTVSVTIDTSAVTVNLTADPTSISNNSSTTLTWESTNADECTASGDWSGSKAATGTETINSLTSDSHFILSCSNASESVSGSVDVTINTTGYGTALLSWTPPTENTDNSPLTDLAGYRIYYGTTSHDYTETITINDPMATSYLIENLSSSDWFFAITSFNSLGIESEYSEEATKTID
jgi:hypothetical protein